MRGNTGPRFPDKQISTAQARAQLAQMLASATDERVAAMTAESLARMFRVPPREAECALLAQQDKRRREAMNRPI